MDGHSGINDYTLQALADNELDREEAEWVQAHIMAIPEAQKRYEAICAQKILLRRWWKNRFPA